MPSQAQGKRRAGTAASNDKPSEKRSRVSRACDQCRTAREKCDGAQPTCLTCTSSNRACSYTANPKKRGIQPGYIRTLELALTWVFNNVPGSESALNRKLLQEGAASILLARDTKESNKLHKNWRRTKFCRDIDKLLSGEEIHGRDESRSDTEDQDSDPEEPPHESNPNGDFIDIDAIAIPGALQDHHPTPRPSIDNPLTRLPSCTWRLLDVYFTYTQCWLPICEKQDILKISYSYPEEGLALSSTIPGSGNHAELWSILSLAALQENAIGNQNSQLVANEAEEEASPKRLYNIARDIVPLEHGLFELGHVKALLNLALVNISQSAPEAAWLLVGNATRILMRIGSDASSTSLPLPRYKHVFAGCFLIDIILSMQLQKRPYLTHVELDQIGRIDEDGLEEWQPWTALLDSRQPSHQRTMTRMPARSLSTFNRLVELFGIAGSPVVHEGGATLLQETLGKLELWKNSLPPTLDFIKSDRARAPSSPPGLLLQLSYNCAIIALMSSNGWLQRTLNLFDHINETLGFASSSPLLLSFLGIVGRNKALDADQRLRYRLQRLREDFVQIWSEPRSSLMSDTPTRHMTGLSSNGDPMSTHSRRSFGSAVQMPTPDSLQMPFNQPFASNSSNRPIDGSRPRNHSTFIDDLLPDMNQVPSGPVSNNMHFPMAGAAQGMDVSRFNINTFDPPPLMHRGSNASRDMENFFDELASLDGAEKVDAQPQFMQNLGFAPDANLTDLLSADFSQFNPMMPYLPSATGAGDSVQMDHTHFFDGG